MLASFSQPPPTSLDGLAALLCEDEPIIRMNSAELLEELGMTVVEAGDGAEALRMASAHSIDILVTDIGLPDISGIDLAAKIRGMKPKLPVLFVSGRADVPEARALTDVELLEKPFRQSSLRECLERLLLSGRPRNRQ